MERYQTTTAAPGTISIDEISIIETREQNARLFTFIVMIIALMFIISIIIKTYSK